MSKSIICPNCSAKLDGQYILCPECGFDFESAVKKTRALPDNTILAGKYETKEVLQADFFAITYLAQDLQTNTPITIKEFFPYRIARRSDTLPELIPTDEVQFRQLFDLFIEEAKMLSDANGSGTASLYTCFQENHTAYYVLEYMQGKTLSDYIKEKGGSLAPDEALRITEAVAHTLDAVHQKGFLYKAVRPKKIFIQHNGSVRLLSPGADWFTGAKRTVYDGDMLAEYEPEKESSVIINPYSAPEVKGESVPAGIYSDQYSLAACFYTMVTGRSKPTELNRGPENTFFAWQGINSTNAMTKNVISTALSYTPETRYKSMTEFIDALKASLQQNAQGAPVWGQNMTGSQQPVFSQNMTGSQQPVFAQNMTGSQQPVFAQNMTGSQQPVFTQNMTGSQQPVFGQNMTGSQPMYTQNVPVKQSNKKNNIVIGVVAFIAAFAVAFFAVSQIAGRKKADTSEDPAQITDITVQGSNNTDSDTSASAADPAEYERAKANFEEQLSAQTWTEDGIEYSGIKFNGYLQGYGTVTFADGEIHEGYFDNGTMIYGTIYYTDGDRYVGALKDGLKHGYGTYYWNNGAEFHGEWENDSRNGYGEYIYESDSIYDFYCGYYINGYQDSEGVAVRKDNGAAEKDMWSNGEISYEIGSFNQTDPEVATLLEIHYTQTWTDGDTTYTGHRANGVITGEGKAEYSSGSVYEGEFSKGLQHGYGTYTFYDGDKVTGSFRDGGIYGWAESYMTNEGYNYFGNYHDTLFEGYGEYHYLNDDKLDVYYGMFSGDDFDGDSIVYRKDGTISAGTWSAGEPTGTFTLYNTDGSTCEAVYENGEWKTIN